MAAETDPVDWELDADNDLKIPLRFTRGRTAVGQRLRIRLQMWFAEWFANRRIGVKWRNTVNADGSENSDGLLGEPYDSERIDGELRGTILDTEDVIAILSFESAFDTATRIATVSYRVMSKFGEVQEEDLEIIV